MQMLNVIHVVALANDPVTSSHGVSESNVLLARSCAAVAFADKPEPHAKRRLCRDVRAFADTLQATCRMQQNMPVLAPDRLTKHI